MDPPKTKVLLDHEVFPDRRCRMILIGKTGNGKSSTGNTILGREVFKPQTGVNSGTDQCGFDETWRNNIKIMVMDTPGLSDTRGMDDTIAERINTSLMAMHPGPHVIILCLRCDTRFTMEESQTIEMLKNIFGERMMEHLVVVFVGKDALGASAESELKRQVEQSTRLKPFLESIGNRYVLLDNTGHLTKRNKQMEKLFDVVKMVVVQNGGFFRHKVSAEITDTLVAVKKEELRIRKARVITKPGNKKAKSEVSAPTELEPSPTQDKPVRKTSSDDADGAEEQTQDKTMKKTSSDDADGAEEQTQDKPVRKTSSDDADGAEEQTQDKTVRKTSSDDADGAEEQTQDKTVRKTSSDDADGAEEQTQSEVLTLELEDIRRVGLVKAGKKRFSELSRGNKVPEFVKRSHSEGYLPEAQARAGDSAATQLVPDWNTEKEEEDDITETVDKLLVTTGEEQGKDYEDILATVLDNPDINQKEKERMFEDALIRKIVTHPEELNDAQRARMEESARSVGKKVKEGMAKFALKTIDQCRLM